MENHLAERLFKSDKKEEGNLTLTDMQGNPDRRTSMSKDKTTDRWENKISSKLVGKTIAKVEYLSPKEGEEMMGGINFL